MKYTDKKKYEVLLKKDRERKQREKERREQQEEESQSQASSSTPSSSFKHRSTIVRSLEKAENGTVSPSKRQEVITNLASKYQIRVVLQEPKNTGPKPTVLTEAEEEWLVCLTGANFVFRIIFELHKVLQSLTFKSFKVYDSPSTGAFGIWFHYLHHFDKISLHFLFLGGST